MSGSTENQQQDKPVDAGGGPRESDAPRETEAPRESEAPKETEAPRSGGAPGRGLSLFALLLALGAVAASVWQWHEYRNRSAAVSADLAKKIAEFERHSKEGRDLAHEVRQSSGDTQAKITALESRIAESQSKQNALDQLSEELSRNRDEWALAEIEQSLLIANQQLQLAGNVKAALAALQSADTRLQRMERPQFANVRKSLARDIERLKALPQPDVVGISARIESLIAKVDVLPLAPDLRPQAEAPASAPVKEGVVGVWERFWQDAWSEVKQLIRVQRMEKPELPLLAPEQRFFLRENMKLRLLGARLALLARDEKSFREDLQAGRAWLERYFDARDMSVAQTATSLADLHGTQISIEAPDISATIEALRSVRGPRERGAG